MPKLYVICGHGAGDPGAETVSMKQSEFVLLQPQ